MGSRSTSLPYGVPEVTDEDILNQRGRMLVYSHDSWTQRNRMLRARSLVKWVYITLLLYFPGSLAVLYITGLSERGDNFFILFEAFPFCTVGYLVILTVLLTLAYRTLNRRPLAGIYENGVGLADGTFVPYMTMGGVERDRRYGPLRSDQVVFYTEHVERRGLFWIDPTPRLPFDFLRMDGLKAVIDILDADPTRGPPCARPPS